MNKGVGITMIIIGAVVSLFGIYQGITQNSIDPGYVLAAVGLSFTVSSALILHVNDSLNKRIDDLRDDVKGIDQRLQNHRHP